MRVPGRCDVCVVGGGAAGLAAAIAAAEGGASVVGAGARARVRADDPRHGQRALQLLERAALTWGRYNDPGFVEAVCGPGFGEDVLAFFEGCGLAWAEEDGGRLYPALAAGGLGARGAARPCREGGRRRWRRRARRAGIGREAGRLARDVRGRELGLRSSRAPWCSRWAGGEGLARSLGLASRPFEPVLCSLACEAPGGVSLTALDGRRAHVVARLLRDGTEVASERGEVLFRDYGLSGIAVFDLSRCARPDDVIALDLTCGLDEGVARHLAETAGGCAGLLDPLIARALGDSLDRARDLRLVVQGPAEPERAQVTRGGLLTSQFDPATLGAHGLPGLFACGEALHVDGACGGFNLAWAWKSGLVAGAAAAR